jgi:cullin-4
MKQAVVLMSFNKSERLSLADLRELTGLEDGELRRTLQSLACGVIGTRALTKEPKGRDVNDEDVFFFNGEFVNKMFRIKINTIQVCIVTDGHWNYDSYINPEAKWKATRILVKVPYLLATLLFVLSCYIIKLQYLIIVHNDNA